MITSGEMPTPAQYRALRRMTDDEYVRRPDGGAASRRHAPGITPLFSPQTVAVLEKAGWAHWDEEVRAFVVSPTGQAFLY